MELALQNRNAYIVGTGTPFCNTIGAPISFDGMSIGDRVRRARKKAGLTQKQLGDAVGVRQATISDLEKGESRSSSYLVQIARICDVDVDWLVSGKGEMEPRPAQVAQHPSLHESNVAPPPKMEGYVPVISWVQAGSWTEVCNVDAVSEEMVPRPPGCSDRTFALRVKGQSMAPKYEPDLIIYVDPEVMPFDGDDVVAVLTDSNEATFKQFVEEPGFEKMLKARNPAWPDPYISINGNCEIIGVVIGSLWLRKPRA
ncbi:LexA family protein [Halomonas caseinilytica]|uniref:LexA family protein n=1 Tax=Halomonas caseinilytica TaxID=438744 RepID=UPI000B2F69AE|nr:XRE family transcriptional regulator [Halomonas caseinilytica]